MTEHHVVDEATARRFLEGRRFAVVGASSRKGNAGAMVVDALVAHGKEVVAVHPSGGDVGGCPGFSELAAVPGALDGVVVVVPADEAVGVVHDCAALGVRSLWLFHGVGAGSDSAEALAAAAEAGMAVVPGACPLMFLEPVSWFHAAHRSVRRHRRALVR